MPIAKTYINLSKLSEELHTDVSKARVTYLEFGTVLLLNQNVSEYLSRLGDMPKMIRKHFKPETLYYETKGEGTT